MRDLRISKKTSFVAFVALALALACAPAAFATNLYTISEDKPTQAASAAATAAYNTANAVPDDHKIDIAGSGSAYTAELSGQTIKTGDFPTVVQAALDYVRTHDDGDLWRVVIPSGSHNMGDNKTGLYMYSNTIFDCRSGATIYQGSSMQGQQILRCGKKTDIKERIVANPGGYDDYKNMYVLGGTFVGHPSNRTAAELANSDYKGCNIRFGHATGVHIIGVTVKENVGAHHVELGAVKDCEIVDCTFTGSYGAGSLEAVQLDITHRHYQNFDNYYPYDDLPTIDTTIENCTFTNVTRGVGTHHLILGTTFDNITIKNNTFTNTADRAIAAANFRNSTITGNTMTNVMSGIWATNMVAGQTYLKIDDSSYTGSKTLNMNTKITNNKIALKNSGSYAGSTTKYGIRAGGAELTSGSYTDYKTAYNWNNGECTNNSVSKTLPTGKYYVSGLTITGNTITGGVGNITSGIRLDYLSGSTIENNKVSAGNFGIEVLNSTNVSKINGNTISGIGNHGMYVYKSASVNEISGNTITAPKAHGISVRDGAKATTVANNKITNAVQNGINIESVPNVKVTGNNISGSTITGIVVKGSSKANVSSNTLYGNKKFGMWVDASANATIASNAVRQSSDVGIFMSNSNNSTIDGNLSSSTINTASKFEIVVNGSAGSKITDNRLGPRRLKNGNHIPIIASALPAANIKNNVQWARLWGSAALDTMAQITQVYGRSQVAVVATNASFKDSLAAAALAGSYSAPMLTTSKNGLSAQTKSELQRMGVKTVYLVGTTAEVSNNVINQMKSAGVKTVMRITGSSPSIRAVNCAKTQKSRSDTVIIATQANFKDALSISPYAYASKSPILYIESNKKLSSTTVNYIKSAKFKKAIIVGGPVPIPASVENQLKNAGISANNITRLAGSNEYKTSRVIAEWATGKLQNGTGGSGLYQYANIKFQPGTRLGVDKLGIARADDPKIGWKDALAGAALCGKNKSVLLLCDDKATPYSGKGFFTEEFVKNNKAGIYQGYVFGGTGAVSYNVFNKLVTISR